MRLLQRTPIISAHWFKQPNCLRALTAALLVLSSYPVTAQSGGKGQQYEQSLESVTREIRQITGDLNKSKKLLKSEQDQLAELEQKMTDLRRQQASTMQQQEKYRLEISELEARLEELNQSQSQNRQTLEQLIVHRYKAGSPNYLKLLLNQQNPFAVGRLSHFYRYFSEAQRDKLHELSEQLGQVQVLRQQAADKSAALAATEQQLASQKQSLESLANKRNQRVASLNQKVTEGSDRLKKLRADRERLNALLAQIAEQARRLRELEKQREEQARRAAESNQNKSQRKPPTRQPVAGGFQKQRGRLAPPVTAKLSYGFGSRLAESGMPAQGHFYDTESDQQVAAVFRGNVLFADYLKGYGLLLIIDHGDDHISLYGHNEVLYKRVGDSVKTGEVVAKSGVSGGLRRPGLYFEIRQNAVPVDPKKWLSD